MGSVSGFQGKMIRRVLLVMAKWPAPGHTKTRLAPLFSGVEAADLYACFLRDALELARSVPGVTPAIAYAPPAPEAAAYFRWLAPDLPLVAQQGESLGERLARVLTQALQGGFDQAAAMNSDSPTLPGKFLVEAFSRLDDPAVDVVLGPSEDGGYYLIGWKRPYPRLVREVQMSTARVLEDTLAIAGEEDLKVSLLDPWYDVDSPADVRRLQGELAQKGNGAAHTRRFFQSRA